MLQKIKNTLKHSFVYSLGNLAVKIIGLILLPMYTNHLSTAEYGVLSIFETTAAFLLAVFSLGISNAMMRWWADVKDKTERKSYVFTTFSFLLVVIFTFNLVLQPFSSNFSNIFFSNNDFSIYFNILFVSVAFDMLNRYIYALVRILEKSKLYIFISSAKLVLILSLNIYFVAVLKIGVKGIILAQMIGHILGFILLLPLLFKHIVFKFQQKVLGEMLKYSIPLTFTALSGILFNMGDRYVLKFLTDDARVGIYSLAYKIAGFLNFFVLQSFQMAFLPIAYKMYKDKDAKRFFSKILTYLIIVLTFGALGISLFSEEFVKIFAPTKADYWEASQYVYLITLNVVILGIRYMFSLHFHVSKKTKLLPIFVSSFAVLNIALNFFTIPLWGITGAILSSIVSNILITITYFFVSRKYFYVNYEIKKVVFAVIVGVVLFCINLLLKDFNVWLKLGLKSIVLFVFPVIILLGGFLEPIEKERLIQSWAKWKNPKKWKDNFK